MIKFVVLFTIITIINCGELPKLSNFVGIGYDLAQGNPKTDKIDPGLRERIFEITYNDGQTTEDNKFLIPDKMDSRNSESCSYTATATEYSGTKKYQNELKTLVKASASADFMVDVSFSTSVEYKSMKKTTNDEQTIVAESTARCEVYNIEMPVFAGLPINENFKQAIEMVHKKYKDWSDIVQHFGTHYIYNAILGGRMHLQHKITKTKYQELKAMGIDINAATTLKFAKFSSDISTDWQSHEKEINAFEKRVEETKEIYIGGKPPKGDWKEWFDLVVKKPMPVSYSVGSIADLISETYFPDFNEETITDLKNGFNSYLKQYCDRSGCEIPGNDVAFPPPVKVNTTSTIDGSIMRGLCIAQSLQQTFEYGYDDFKVFKDDLPYMPLMNVREVLIADDECFINYEGGYEFYEFLEDEKVNIGKCIRSLQFLVSDDVHSRYTAIHGSVEPSKNWTVPENEYITQIEMVSDEYIRSLRFITNNKVKSPLFGHQDISGVHPPMIRPFNYTMYNLKGNLVGATGCLATDSNIIKLAFITNNITY